MIGYPEWRHQWDHAGGWPPTRDDITTLLTELDRQTADIVEWLVATGYPFDWSTPDQPLPEPLRRPLAEAWLRRDGIDGEDIDDYLDSLEAEGAW